MECKCTVEHAAWRHLRNSPSLRHSAQKTLNQHWEIWHSAITDVHTASAYMYPNEDIDESDPVSEVVAATRTETNTAILF